ncbi:HNH endonuclease [Cryobacterium shii]|uniref:HNH nuclease domain-containing protein n=1 Tax=Cryobacterium shii TaxID=1259235 RepID=A0AAQ2HHG0_9MICO|nr:HNH endonuclease [Cryobacterium shii]TFC53299.1 hypothetical protein E3O49_00035 [Cryobacterium shii]
MSDTRNRLTPVSAATRELYLYSGNRCAFQTAVESCNKSLLRDDGTWNCEVAHIQGVKLTAARGDHSLDDEQLRDPQNLLLVCREHHKVIDNKDLEDRYTVAVVKKMKSDHESWYREAMAGLARIVDTTAGLTPRFPVNLRALDGVDDGAFAAESLPEMTAFVSALAKQPIAIRDLIALILIHGDLEPRFGTGLHKGIGASVVHIEGVANIKDYEIERRAKHLEQAGLLATLEDDDLCYFTLTSPLAKDGGWDIFADLKTIAGDDASLIKQAILDLDFTVFDR